MKNLRILTKTNIFIFIILAIIIALILILKNYYPIKTEKNLTSPQTIYVGWIGPLTGLASIIGVDNLNSVKLAFSEYEAKKGQHDPHLKLVSADNQDDTEKSIHEYNKMLHPIKPVAIFLSTRSSVKALAKKAYKDSIILIDPIDNDETLSSLNPNVFLIAKETEQLSGIDADAIISDGRKNTLILYNRDDEFMRALAMTIKEVLSSTGRNASHLMGYQTSTIDFRPFFKESEAFNIDSYVFFGYREIGFAMKQARDLGVKDPFYSVNVITDPILQKNSEGSINGTYFAHFTKLDGNIVKTDEFIDKYIKKYGKAPQPEWVAMQAYDAANILILAIKDSLKHDESNNIVANIRDNLLQITDYEGVSGNITIKPNGTSKGIYPNLYQIQNGLPVKVNP